MGNMRKTHRIAPEVKDQILKRIKEEGLSVEEAAKDAGVHNTTIGELVRLKRQNEELLALVGELTLKASQSQKKN